MAIKTLLKIDGKDYTGQILIPFQLERNKLWSSAGRVMSGKMSGTLIGIFPKMVVEFHPKDAIELSQLMRRLDQAKQTIVYYDPRTRSMQSIDTYTADYQVITKDLKGNIDAIKATFIALEKE